MTILLSHIALPDVFCGLLFAVTTEEPSEQPRLQNHGGKMSANEKT